MEAIINAIGNVVDFAEIDGVLFTLSADAQVRMNDVDSAILVTRTACPSQAKAEACYASLVSKAKAMAA